MRRSFVIGIVVAAACSSKPAAPPVDEGHRLRTEADAHRRKEAWDAEARVLDQLLAIAPGDRAAILRRARLVLDHDRRDAAVRDPEIDALLARARAAGDGCDLVRVEETVAARRLARAGDDPAARAAAAKALEAALPRCADLGTVARLHRTLAELAPPDDAAGLAHACAAIAAGDEDTATATRCAGSAAADPGAKALAEARLATDPAARLARIDAALAARPALVGALAARVWALRDLGRTTDACAALAPYLAALQPTFDRDFPEEIRATTWREHTLGLKKQLGCP